MNLTDTSLRSLKPKPGRAERLVADTNGLYIRIRVGEGGIARSWQFRRIEGGRIRISALGTYPDVSIKEARLKAAELATKRTASTPTVQAVAERWLTEQVDVTHRKADLVRGYVDRAILPVLSNRRVRDIEPADIADVIRSYRDRVAKHARARTGGKPASRALLGVCKGLFLYAVESGFIKQSPAAQLTAKVVGARTAERNRVLSEDEIKLVMSTKIPQGAVLRFLLATGLRIGERYKGYREGQYWIVAPQFSKNGKEHRVWLSDLALAQLEQPLEPRHSVQKWVTEHAGGWTAHDLRRTFSTRMNEKAPKGIGVAPHIVEKMLNHTLGGMMSIYNQADYDDERRQALGAWSSWLLDLAGHRPAGIVQLRQTSSQVA